MITAPREGRYANTPINDPIEPHFRDGLAEISCYCGTNSIWTHPSNIGTVAAPCDECDHGDTIIRLANEGHNAATIGRKLGLKYDRVRYILKKAA